MIRYLLICDNEHEFESWFAGASAFDALQIAGQLECPSCGSTHVRKAIMAPNVSASTRQRGRDTIPDTSIEQRVSPSPAGSPAALAKLVGGSDPEILAAVRKLRAHISENADYVGPRFAEEARKIHDAHSNNDGDGDTSSEPDNAKAWPRAIYGEASIEETVELLEDGIDVLPLPRLPEDNN